MNTLDDFPQFSSVSDQVAVAVGFSTRDLSFTWNSLRPFLGVESVEDPTELMRAIAANNFLYSFRKLLFMTP